MYAATMAHSVYVRNQFSHSVFEIWAGHLYAGALSKVWRLRTNVLVNYQRIQNLYNCLEMRQSVSFDV